MTDPPDITFSESTQIDGHSNEEDAEARLARSRERNREHARRTRLRKKAQLQKLQTRMKELENEGRILKQNVEECSIATILLGLSNSTSSDENCRNDDTNDKSSIDISSPISATGTRISIPTCIKGRRKRFISDSLETDQEPTQFKFQIRGKNTIIGGGSKNHINWKTGVYSDENGHQQQLTNEELESLRRERNRMHAKMTRHRKKNFISSVEKAITQLEEENQKMRNMLQPHTRKNSNEIGSVVKNTTSSGQTFELNMNSMMTLATPAPMKSMVPTANMKEQKRENEQEELEQNDVMSGFNVVA